MNEQEWLECKEPTPMLEFLGRNASERKLRLVAVACCRSIWLLLRDEQSRNAVVVCERFVDGLAERNELESAQRDAQSAIRNVTAQIYPSRNHMLVARWASATSAQASSKNIRKNGHSVIREAAYAAGENAGLEAIPHERDVRARFAKLQSERAYQAGLVQDIFGNPFHPITINPTWLTPTVLSLAQAVYDNRNLPSGSLQNDRLTVLADALEDAGATGVILEHLRSEGPHMRGCFALDLVLGKE